MKHYYNHEDKILFVFGEHMLEFTKHKSHLHLMSISYLVYLINIKTKSIFLLKDRFNSHPNQPLKLDWKDMKPKIMKAALQAK